VVMHTVRILRVLMPRGRCVRAGGVLVVGSGLFVGVEWVVVL
jgi:hypothetical protein